MTPEQKEDYIAGGGQFCPYCKSISIKKVNDEFDMAGHAHYYMACEDCKEEWTDTFTLTDVT